MPCPTSSPFRAALLATLLAGCAPANSDITATVDLDHDPSLDTDRSEAPTAPLLAAVARLALDDQAVLEPSASPAALELPVGEPVVEDSSQDALGDEPDAGCVDDNHENNDVSGDASPLLVGWYGSLIACDDDWYWFDMLAGDALTIGLIADGGAVNLYLIDPQGNEVAVSGSAPEQGVQHTAEVNGTYLVHVELLNGPGAGVGAGYDLTADWEPCDCSNDQYEPNDSDLQPWPVLAGTYVGLTVCPYGDDFFAVWLEIGDVLVAEITNDAADADLDLTLFDPDNQWLVDSAIDGSSETVIVTAATAGYHDVWVELVDDRGDSPGAAYTLKLAVY